MSKIDLPDISRFAVRMSIEGAELRPLGLDDVDALRDAVARAREPLSRWVPHLTALSDAEKHVRIKLKQVDVGRAIEWGIWSGGTLLGCAGLYDIRFRNDALELGYWLAPDACGRGLATRAGARLAEHAFEVMGMHRLTAKCIVDNLASRAVPIRLGMVEEALIREAWKVNGRYVDHVIYRMLRDEWAAVAPACRWQGSAT